MAISPDQRQYRSRRLGSSDATRVMAGDWHQLWLEKTGRVEPDNLDFVPAVQIGIVTEALHPKFWERRTGLPCLPANGRSYAHSQHDWLVCHPDFLTWEAFPLDPFAKPDTLLEAKFCGSPKSDEELGEQYYWQVQHQMLVAGLDKAVLSILRPGSYSWLAIPYSAPDQARLMENLQAFWWHVENDIEPGDPLPVPAPDLDQMRIVDMGRHNEFASHAATLLTCREDWAAYRAAEAGLKALMPEDARIAFVAEGLYLSRSRDGRITLRFGRVSPQYTAKAEPWGDPMSDKEISWL
ncbi:YqaJ viral recombinase family protein [Aerophototrophica crusticola]|uniref:YqaJ viral recombinase family protein n=1 Tax=Aerophototrophica crusticola TaxID=1709002 RepID=A0A858R6N5_9PROT|nr:YqaJ viral recombinase family protein [Rhodospirillaceae bacterium B3]